MYLLFYTRLRIRVTINMLFQGLDVAWNVNPPCWQIENRNIAKDVWAGLWAMTRPYVRYAWPVSKLDCNDHDDVIKWKHFPRYWPFVRGIHRFPVNSPHKGQWRGTLMFSLICAWINDRVNNRQTGDLRRHCGHYDVNVMWPQNGSTRVSELLYTILEP